MNSVIDNQLDQIKLIKVGVLIPDRGDREEFLRNCHRMMLAQTITPYIIRVEDFPAEDDKIDITKRYRRGYDALRNQGLDVIVFIENDDWYHPEYLETMVREWHNHGRPELFGTTYSIYFHLNIKYYYKMQHFTRASAMNTLIKPDLKMDGIWPVDHEPFTDMHLWQSRLKKMVFTPNKIISMGMKHGVGLCGSKFHTERLDRYTKRGQPDDGFLQQTLDPESFNFYWNYFN